jgi:hypothetical protein
MADSRVSREQSKDIGELLGPILGFAITALGEGGHRIEMNQVWEKIMGFFPSGSEPKPPYEMYSETNERQERLSIHIGPAPGEDLEDPKEAEIQVELFLPGSISASVSLTRRTDGPWIATSVGTLSLPVAHAIGELAHNDRFLGLARERSPRELDERTAERGLMEMGHIFKRTS